MQVPEAQRMFEVESWNGMLKGLLAEAHLDMHALKNVLAIKRWPRRQCVRRLGEG